MLLYASTIRWLQSCVVSDVIMMSLHLVEYRVSYVALCLVPLREELFITMSVQRNKDYHDR